MNVRLIVFVLIKLSLSGGPQLSNPADNQSAMQAAAERQRAGIQRALAESLEKQRKSVRAQAKSAVEVEASSDAFFIIPWPKPVGMDPGIVAECPPLPAAEVDALVLENARNESLEPDLLREVMRRESAFRPCAVSRAGAQGLMQLMPATAGDFHVSDVFNPKQNVAAGAKFLKTLLNRYNGDVALALGAYNAGPGRVDEAGGVPQIAETQNYVRAILGSLSFH